MKTNEEFLEGVYGKRDALIKKRKKRNSVVATAACAALCIGVAVSAGVFNSQSADKTESKAEIELDHMNSGEIVSGETNYISVEDETTRAGFGYDGNAQEKPESVQDAEGKPEMFTQTAAAEAAVTKIAATNAQNVSPQSSDDKIYKEEGGNEIGQSVVEMPEEESQAGGVVASTAAPEAKPMPSTEEIVEAAYNSLPDEEKQYVIKDSAEAMVTRYADGTQTYAVGFRTTLDQYRVIKLDSELNVIQQKCPAD